MLFNSYKCIVVMYCIVNVLLFMYCIIKVFINVFYILTFNKEKVLTDHNQSRPTCKRYKREILRIPWSYNVSVHKEKISIEKCENF